MDYATVIKMAERLARDCYMESTRQGHEGFINVFTAHNCLDPFVFLMNQETDIFRLVGSVEQAHVIFTHGQKPDVHKWLRVFEASPTAFLIKNLFAAIKPAVVLPWELSSDNKEENVVDVIMRLLHHLDPDPQREGLGETPARAAKAWAFWTSGYDQSPNDVLKVFEDGAKNYDEMVIVKDIPFYSHCEHHLAPIFGTATVGYIPDGKIVGLSKLSRLVEIFARRLQVQERLTNEVAQALSDNLDPIGVGVYIKARHLCMESRGVCQQGHHTITTALRGAMKDEPETRAEFLSACKCT